VIAPIPVNHTNNKLVGSLRVARGELKEDHQPSAEQANLAPNYMKTILMVVILRTCLPKLTAFLVDSNSY
jgi:hypothetical protein